MPSVSPEGAVPREAPGEGVSAPGEAQTESQNAAGVPPHAESEPGQAAQQETVSVPHEKSSDDNAAV